MQKRRNFLKQISSIGAAALVSGITNELSAQYDFSALSKIREIPIEDAVQNEELWKWVQQAYTINPNFINLNNGGVSPQPKIVQEIERRLLEKANEIPSYEMWRVQIANFQNVRNQLAKLAGCSSEEIAINRNATEGIQTVLMGLDWQEGDEIIATEQDYSTVAVGWRYLEDRYKVKVKRINLNTPFENTKDYIQAFKEAISPKTRYIHLTQIINWNGQVVPVKAIRNICDYARSKNIFTLVDGAHSFAQLDFKVPDLGCDAFATSLHKWLCAPFGTGMLYIRKEMISKVWSLMPSEAIQGDQIEKFEHLGTRSFPQICAISQAIDFHNMISTPLKEKRLRYLKNYWWNKVKKKKGVELLSPQKKGYDCGIALLKLEGKKLPEIVKVLTNKFRIHVVSITLGDLNGIRVSPNVYTKLSDLDRLVEAIDYLLEE